MATGWLLGRLLDGVVPPMLFQRARVLHVHRSAPMRSSVLLSFAALGLTVATLAAPSAQAQYQSRTIICRDGSRFDSNNASVCSRHRGVDGRATQEARRIENERSANGRWDDRRDNRDDRHDARDDRRDDNDGRWDGRRNDRDYGYGGRREVYE